MAALALEGGLGLLRALVGIARRQDERLRRLVEVAAQLAAGHGGGLRPPRRLIGTRRLSWDRSVHCPLLASAPAHLRGADAQRKSPRPVRAGAFASTSDLLAIFNVVASRSAQISTVFVLYKQPGTRASVILSGPSRLAKLASMKYVNTHEAKTQLSKLIASVRPGQEIVICQAGKPVGRRAAYEPVRKKPRLGLLEDVITLQPALPSPDPHAKTT